MRLLVVNGSPRPTGSTSRLCASLIAGVAESGSEVDYVCLGDRNISYCKGCRTCHRTGACVQVDDMADLIEAIVRCDALVLASPSYWRDVTAQMKTFIDRCLPLCEHVNPTAIAPGKKGYVLTVRAGSQREESLRLVSTFEHFLNHLRIPLCDALTFEGIASEDDVGQDHLEQAFSFGRLVCA